MKAELSWPRNSCVIEGDDSTGATTAMRVGFPCQDDGGGSGGGDVFFSYSCIGKIPPAAAALKLKFFPETTIKKRGWQNDGMGGKKRDTKIKGGG